MLRLLPLVLALLALPAVSADWVLSVVEPRVKSGARFEFEVAARADEKLPDALGLQVRGDRAVPVIAAEALAPQEGARRRYAAQLPRLPAGAVQLELTDRASGVLVLLVGADDSLRELTGAAEAVVEPPLSENEPIYFSVGTRGDTTARFQLSFKYRLFDRQLGWGRELPWLAGLHFAYTQTSIWNLSESSKPFLDTSYRPSLYWEWRRADEKTWVDAARLGFEHESNGKDGADSRSINTLFVRPEWRVPLADGKTLELAPKVYGYLDKTDNPDIEKYRGYVDWAMRYGDRERSWRALARLGTADKGSFQLDWFERTRMFGAGPVSGYLHAQFLTGYGESLLDYNQRNKSQLRIGFAIVP